MMQYDKDMQSPHKQLFLEARDLLLSYGGMVETKKPRITTYSTDKGGICHMRTTAYGIDFGFLKGAKMDDKYGQLSGDGKIMRVLQIKDELSEEEVRYYIDQAIAFLL